MDSAQFYVQNYTGDQPCGGTGVFFLCALVSEKNHVRVVYIFDIINLESYVCIKPIIYKSFMLSS